jgi:hypothetical protein
MRFSRDHKQCKGRPSSSGATGSASVTTGTAGGVSFLPVTGSAVGCESLRAVEERVAGARFFWAAGETAAFVPLPFVVESRFAT